MVLVVHYKNSCPDKKEGVKNKVVVLTTFGTNMDKIK